MTKWSWNRSGSTKLPSGLLLIVAALVLALIGLAAIAIRGRGTELGHIRLHPVAGKLVVNGQPAANAMIAFHPLDKSASRSCRHVATTQADGTYRLMTFAPGDGAPAGAYAVTVVWLDFVTYDECADVLTHDRLKGMYADAATTPLKATVVEGDNNLALLAFASGGWSEPRRRDVVEEAKK